MTATRPDIVVRDDRPDGHQAFLRCLAMIVEQTRDDGAWEGRDDGWTRGGWSIRVRGSETTIGALGQDMPRGRRALVRIHRPVEGSASENPASIVLEVLRALTMIDGRGDDPRDKARMRDWKTTMMATSSKGMVWMNMQFPWPMDPGWVGIGPDASAEGIRNAERILDRAPTMMHWDGYMDGDVPHVLVRPVSLDTGTDGRDDPLETMRSIARVEEEIGRRERPGRA